MMRKMILGIMVIAIGSTSVGCMTLMVDCMGHDHEARREDKDKKNDHVHPRIYGGTRNWLDFLGSEDARKDALGIIFFVDLPASFVLDTALLPVTYVVWLVASPDEGATGRISKR